MSVMKAIRRQGLHWTRNALACFEPTLRVDFSTSRPVPHLGQSGTFSPAPSAWPILRLSSGENVTGVIEFLLMMCWWTICGARLPHATDWQADVIPVTEPHSVLIYTT